MPLIGEPAPDFELRDQHGATHTLTEHAGRRAVLVVFYPYAFSSVCTRELDAVRSELVRFDADDVAVRAVSCDPVHTLRAFAERDDLTFPLLSDFWPHGEVARGYDVFDEVRGCARRSSFVVDRAGLVRWAVHNEMGKARELDEPLRVLARLTDQK